MYVDIILFHYSHFPHLLDSKPFVLGRKCQRYYTVGQRLGPTQSNQISHESKHKRFVHAEFLSQVEAKLSFPNVENNNITE